MTIDKLINIVNDQHAEQVIGCSKLLRLILDEIERERASLRDTIATYRSQHAEGTITIEELADAIANEAETPLDHLDEGLNGGHILDQFVEKL